MKNLNKVEFNEDIHSDFSEVVIKFENYSLSNAFFNSSDEQIKLAINEILFDVEEKHNLKILLLGEFDEKIFDDKIIKNKLKNEIGYRDAYGMEHVVRENLLIYLIKMYDSNKCYGDDYLYDTIVSKMMKIYGKMYLKELNVYEIQEKYLFDKE